MGRWRSKLVTALIVYAAGFVSAVYVLSSPQTEEAGQFQADTISQWTTNINWSKAGLEAKPWAEKAQAAAGRIVTFVKEQSVVLADAVKTKVDQTQRDRSE